MAAVQKQRVRITDLCADYAEITGSIEQAGIPAIPVRQQLFDLFAKVHRANVYDARNRYNDALPG